MLITRPLAVGSGKSGIPLARMHLENLTIVSWSGGFSRSPPWSAVEAAFRYARQYWPGPELPCPPLFVPLYPPGIAGFQLMWITLLVSMVGSAWLASPWLRIQAPHSSTSLVALPFGGAVDAAPVGVEVVYPLPLLVGRLATWGELDPPPQAASPIVAAATMTASLAVISRALICLPSVGNRPRLYGTESHTQVTRVTCV